MNKKKIAALALSGTLLMGAAGFGAYSWFTSTANVSSNLTITTGSLKLENLASDKWTSETKDSQAVITNVTQAGKDHSVVINVQPNDMFQKIVEIKSTGSLDQNVKVKVNNKVLGDWANKATIKVIDEKTGEDLTNHSAILKSHESINAKIQFRINPELGDEMQNKGPVDLSNILGENIIEVSGTQTNAPAPAPEKPAK